MRFARMLLALAVLVCTAVASVSSCPEPVAEALYTRADVALHASDEDAWIIVDDGVYDVTQFRHGHPGGYHAIVHAAGTDATAAFYGRQHPADEARTMLDELRVGTLVADE